MYDIVIGLGQIGQPIFKTLAEKYEVHGRDIEEVEFPDGDVACLHICYPFNDVEGGRFVEVTVNYIKMYMPKMCVIHSTVIPGTTRLVQRAVPFVDVAYSPVKGRHGNMDGDLRFYSKWVASIHSHSLGSVVEHLAHVFVCIRSMNKLESLELAKLVETSYTGVLVAWAQEINRYAEAVEADYDQVIEFTDEIEYLPNYAFVPGHISGHCILPNIELLLSLHDSGLLRAVEQSNGQRRDELMESGEWVKGERIWPKKLS